MLEQEGLVEVRPRVGYRTSRVTLQDVEEIFDLRTILESASAERAATCISEEALRHLEQLASRYAAGDRDSYRLFLSDNLEFHREIAIASGSRRLAQVITQLLEQMQRLLMLRLDTNASGDEMIEEHRAIVDALRNKDGATARDAMAMSITTARQAVVQSLMKRIARWRM
jgi:GntR family transcriptional regulator, rspAB operon transcriptional repressor